MKYTKEILEEAVKNSKSVAQVLIYLGLSPSGGSHSHISRRLKDLGIDHSHFKGQAWNKGNIHPNKRKKAADILVPAIKRPKGEQLTRALLEMGVIHECVECGTGNTYNGKPLTLQVDHKDGDWHNNRLENLQFLCPNCHSQTHNFGSKNRSK